MKKKYIRNFITILLLSLLTLPLLSLRCNRQVENRQQANGCLQDSIAVVSAVNYEKKPHSKFSKVKRQYYALIDSCGWQFLDEQDDLSFLLKPLDELKLDGNYILSDFRKPWAQSKSSLDESILRLYVRKRSVNRPDNDYFDEEYWKYEQCVRDRKDYKNVQGSVPFLDPFEKIWLSGSDLGLWQAYLLYFSKNMFGMRGGANYNFEFLITCSEDVDDAIALIKKWEGEKNFNLYMKNDTTAVKKEKDRKHMEKVRMVVDFLKNLKNKELDPVFSRQGNTIYIEHYSLMEFAGLLRRKIAIDYDRQNRKIKEIDEWVGRKYDDYMRDFTMAHYRHRVWY